MKWRKTMLASNILNSLYTSLNQGTPDIIAKTISKLFRTLFEMRRDMSKVDWDNFCNDARQHPLFDLMKQDPFTMHGISRPRGYPGDAALMDYLYRITPINTTEFGKQAYDFMSNAPEGKGVCNRAQLIAALIDKIAQNKPIRVLSVASGHLREAAMSQAVFDGKVEITAFDQDPISLEIISKSGIPNVKTMQGSVARLILGRYPELKDFDLVYAAGLYDYLSERIAEVMTTWMVEATKSGGTTLLTNFVHGTPSVGYMEAFMNWHLIYRSMDELVTTTDEVKDQISSSTTYFDADNVIAFVELKKV
jgi:extracellular factor (EF) 3-hydroxypalmitic acid methyl ester biosynthesis protein